MKVRRPLLVAVLATASIMAAGCTTDGNAASIDPTSTTSTSLRSEGDASGTGTPPAEVDDEGMADPGRPDVPPLEARWVEMLTEALRDENDSIAGPDLTDEEIDCLAPRVVGIYGADLLEAAGITPDDMRYAPLPFLGIVVEVDVAHELYDLYAECDIDNVAIYLESALGTDPSPEARDCATDLITDDNLRSVFVWGFSTEEEDQGPGSDPGEDFARKLLLCGNLYE